MKVWRGAEILLHSFVTSALDGGEWTTPRTDRSNPENNLIRGRVGGTADLRIFEKRKKTLARAGIRTPFRLVGLTVMFYLILKSVPRSKHSPSRL